MKFTQIPKVNATNFFYGHAIKNEPKGMFHLQTETFTDKYMNYGVFKTGKWIKSSESSFY